MKKLYVFGLLLCALLMATPAVAKEAKKAPAKKEPPAGVLARVGQDVITDAEVEEILARTSPKGRPPDAKRRIVEDLVEVYVFAQEGQKAGLLKDAEVKKRLKEATTLILARAFYNRFVDGKAVASDEMVAAEYEKNKANFVSKTQLHLQHILVKEKAEAEKVLARLKKGEPFEEVAKAESKDPMSARKGGDLGWQALGTLDRSFEQAAVALKPGELSGPVQSRFGWHIIKLIERKEPRQLELDEVKEVIRGSLKRQAMEKLREEYVEKADVEIYLKDEPQAAPEEAEVEEAPAGEEGEAGEPAGGVLP